MSTRLYYTDSYLTTFDASVIEAIEVEGRPAVILDQSAFYPTSGGQPFDTGTLGDTRVVDVVDLEDGRLAHVVSAALAPGTIVNGNVDWSRRFDHMQQHTGQHVLSAAFEHLHHARTESFHLGSAVSTIDFASALDADQIAAAEAESNRIVWEDRLVRMRFAPAEEAARLPLRKESMREGTLRLVEIDGYDLSACGGTHVTSTGGIGVIAVSGFERFKGGTRVEFLCGGRALARFGQQRDTIAACVRHLSVLPSELPAGIERLQADLKEQRSAIKGLQSRLAGYEAAALAGRARDVSGVHLVAERVDGFDAQSLKGLAQAIVARPGYAVVLLGSEAAAPIVVARAADVALDAGVVLRQLTARFGGKGGGRPELAQGGGLAPADEVLAAAEAMVRAHE